MCRVMGAARIGDGSICTRGTQHPRTWERRSLEEGGRGPRDSASLCQTRSGCRHQLKKQTMREAAFGIVLLDEILEEVEGCLLGLSGFSIGL